MSSQTNSTTITASTSSSTAESSSSVKSNSNSSEQSTTANKLFVDKDNRTKRFLWVTIVLLLIAVCLIAALIYLFTQTSSSASKTNSTNDDGQNGQPSCLPCCQTESCQRYSRALMDIMDLTADPCDDFYKYACGNWHKHQPVVEVHGFSSRWRTHKILIYDTFRLALEEVNKSARKSKAIQYLSDLYHECVDVQRREQLGIEPLRQLLKQMFGSEQWPLLGTSTYSHKHFNTANQQLEQSIFNEFSEFWNSDNSSNFRKTNDSSEFSSLWSFWKSWKLWKSNKNMTNPEDDQADVHQWMDCYVEASLLGVPLFSEQHILYMFNYPHMKPKEYTISIILDCDGVNEEMVDLFTNFKMLKKAISSLSNSQDEWNNSMDQAIFEVMNFNIKFAQVLKSSPAVFDDFWNETHSLITLGELKRNYSSLDWTLLLNKYASRTRADFHFTDHDTVYVQLDQLEVFKPFSELIANTPIRVLKNAMALRVVLYRYPGLKSFLDMKNRKDDITHQNYPLSRMCVMQIFPISLPLSIRIFVDYVGRKKMQTARDQVIEMARHIKETIGESMKTDHSWLDDQTRRKALDKLEAIKYYIGFPDWIFQDDILDKEVGFDNSKTDDSLQVVKGHYATSHFNMMRILTGALFRKTKVTEFSQSERYFMFIFSEQAMYYSHYNCLEITFAYLFDGPYFDEDYPTAINYGNIGNTIGHEMFHSFDSNARFYDKHGNKANWWTDSASEHFHNLSQCFLHQYHGIEDPIRGAKIDAEHSLGEIIADNSGLKQSYLALEKHLEHSNNCCTTDSLPPFLAQFTHEQLYFISFSQDFCITSKNFNGLVDPQKILLHPPENARVRVTMSNLVQMAQAFNCPGGSPMNPKNKCSIW